MAATIYNIAEKAGISYAAVSGILNGNRAHKFATKTVARVRAVAAELGYERNVTAASLKTGKTGNIGMTTTSQFDLVGLLNWPYVSLTVQGVGRGLAEHGYRLIFNNMQALAEDASLMDMARGNYVDGVVYLLLAGFARDFTERQLPLLAKLRTPLVMIHSLSVPFACHNVRVDNIASGRMAAAHLVEHGYGSIGLVGTKSAFPIQNDVLTGYREKIEKAGIGYNEKNIFYADNIYPEDGYKLACRLLDTGVKLPRALVVLHDSLANGMQRAFLERGVSVPDDIALLTALSNAVTCTEYYSDLTRVVQPAEEKGRQAGGLLGDLLHHPAKERRYKTLTVPSELVIGRSCGCK